MKKVILFFVLALCASAVFAQTESKKNSPGQDYSIAAHVELSNLRQLVSHFYEKLAIPLQPGELKSHRADTLLQNIVAVMDSYKELQKKEPRKVKVMLHLMVEKHASIFSVQKQNMFGFFQENEYLFSTANNAPIITEVDQWMDNLKKEPAVSLALR